MPAPGPGRWASLLAHDAVIVAVVHVAIRRMATSYGRDAVPTSLRARDSTVAIVIVLLQRSRAAGSWGLTCRGTLSASTFAAGVTHDAIAITVSHVGIGRNLNCCRQHSSPDVDCYGWYSSPSNVTFSPVTISTSSSSGRYAGWRISIWCGPFSNRNRWKTPSNSSTIPT